MDVASVGLSSGAAQQQPAAVRPQPKHQEFESSERLRDDASATREARAERPSAQAQLPERDQRSDSAERSEPPRPVVNDRGQKTGTIINTTA
jgi:hypothetical protein